MIETYSDVDFIGENSFLLFSPSCNVLGTNQVFSLIILTFHFPFSRFYFFVSFLLKQAMSIMASKMVIDSLTIQKKEIPSLLMSVSFWRRFWLILLQLPVLLKSSNFVYGIRISSAWCQSHPCLWLRKWALSDDSTKRR